MAFLIAIPKRSLIPPASIEAVEPLHWAVTIERPAEISELCISLAMPLNASDLGVGVSYSLPPSTDTEFLGVLTDLLACDIFSTGWPWFPGIADRPLVVIHFHVENAQALLEKVNLKPPVDVKREIARKTALNLFRFVESFSEAGNQALLTNPSVVLDRWFQRFEEKYKIDPNFILKTN